MTANNTVKTDWIEGVKGLACLWICWYHIDQLLLSAKITLPIIKNIPKFGYIGVNVFLIISGFGLAYSISKQQIKNSLPWKKIDWKKFFSKRLLRIYPLYIIAHIIFFILGAALGKYNDMPLDLGFLLSITGLRVFFPQYFWYGPDAFWFVGLIIQLYLLFPVFYWLLNKLGQNKFLLVIFTLCAISRLITINSPHSYEFIRGLATNRMAEFALGMVIGYGTNINKGLTINFFNLRNKYLFMIALFSTILAYFIWGKSLFFLPVIIDLLLGIAAFSSLTIIALFICKIKILSQILIFFGSISYSFYLLHSPPIRPVFGFFTKIGLKNIFIDIIFYIAIIALFAYIFTELENKFFQPKLKKNQ